MNLSSQLWRERLELVRGDITAQPVEAIVNAANRWLQRGGGVDGAIHRVAGPQLQVACNALGGCPPGEAKVTAGFRLPAKHVIHTVGPVWEDGQQHEDHILASCYANCFQRAAELGVKSLAFPSIATGVYGFPIDRACRIALRAIQESLEQNPHLEKVVVVCFEPTVYQHYQTALNEFPKMWHVPPPENVKTEGDDGAEARSNAKGIPPCVRS
jgi:O-acetyl-ADP-ribose deacetylase (regulator of RNase III)